MDPAALAPLLRDYGPWGLLALSLSANVYLGKGWLGCLEGRIQSEAKVAAVLERASLTIAAVTAALESRQGHFERLGQQLAEMRSSLDQWRGRS